MTRRLLTRVLTFLMLTGSGASGAFARARVPPWKMFIDAAYDSQIDRTYSCATVQQAIVHLRPTLLPFSPIGAPSART